MEDFRDAVEHFFEETEISRIHAEYSWDLKSNRICCYSSDGCLLTETEIFFDPSATDREHFEQNLRSDLRHLSVLNQQVSFEVTNKSSSTVFFKTEGCNNFEQRVVEILGIPLRDLYKVLFSHKNCKVEIYFFTRVEDECNMIFCRTEHQSYFNPHASNKLFMEVLDVADTIGFIGTLSEDSYDKADKCIKMAAKKFKARIKKIRDEVDKKDRTTDEEITEKLFTKTEPTLNLFKRVLRVRKTDAMVDLTSDTEEENCEGSQISDDFWFEYCASSGISVINENDDEKRLKELIKPPSDTELFDKFIDALEFGETPKPDYPKDFSIELAELKNKLALTERTMSHQRNQFSSGLGESTSRENSSENSRVEKEDNLTESKHRDDIIKPTRSKPIERFELPCIVTAHGVSSKEKKVLETLNSKPAGKTFDLRQGSRLLNEKEKKAYIASAKPKIQNKQMKEEPKSDLKQDKPVLPFSIPDFSNYNIPKKSKSPVRPPRSVVDKSPYARPSIHERCTSTSAERSGAKLEQFKSLSRAPFELNESFRYLSKTENHLHKFIDKAEEKMEVDESPVIDITQDEENLPEDSKSDKNNNNSGKRQLYSLSEHNKFFRRPRITNLSPTFFSPDSISKH